MKIRLHRNVIFFISIIFDFVLLVTGGGICTYPTNDAFYTDCKNSVSTSTNCLRKCANLNYSPDYSCKIPRGDCTLQCTCNYFSPNYVTPAPTTLPPLPNTKPGTGLLKLPYNECVLFGTHCSSTCQNGTDYCQVTLPGGPKSCVCHHWIRGNTLIAAYNDFLSVGETLYSNNGLFMVNMTNYFTMQQLKVWNNQSYAAAQGLQSQNNSDRFTLKNDNTFIIQSASIDYKGDLYQRLLALYSQLDGSAYMRIEDCGYVIFYDINWKRVMVLGFDQTNPYHFCPDVTTPAPEFAPFTKPT